MIYLPIQHEVEKLLEYCRAHCDFDIIFDSLFRRLQKALSHENFAPLEKALQGLRYYFFSYYFDILMFNKFKLGNIFLALKTL